MNAHDPWSRDNGYGMPQGYPYPPVRPPKRRSKWVAAFLAFFVPGLGHMYLGRMMKGIAIMVLISANIAAIVHVTSGAEVNVLTVVLLSLLFPIIYFYSLFDAIQSTEDVNEKMAAKAGWQPYAYAQPRERAQPWAHPQRRPPAYARAEEESATTDETREPEPEPAAQPAPQQEPQAYGPAKEHEVRDASVKKIAMLAIVIACIAFVGQETWSRWKFDATLSMIGAIVLIGGGVGLWLWELRGSGGPKS